MPVAATETRKIPEISPVATTDLVSRYTQKVTANHTVKLITETTRVLRSRCTKIRCGPVRRSGAGAVWVTAPPGAEVHRAARGDLRSRGFAPHSTGTTARSGRTHRS